MEWDLCHIRHKSCKVKLVRIFSFLKYFLEKRWNVWKQNSSSAWKILQNSQENVREGVLEIITVVIATPFYWGHYKVKSFRLIHFIPLSLSIPPENIGKSLLFRGYRKGLVEWNGLQFHGSPLEVYFFRSSHS